MNKSRVHIDGIEIRLKGISQGAARGAIDGLGDALLRHLASKNAALPRHAMQVDGIDAGRHSMATGISAEDLQKALVEHIGAAIERRITQ